MTPFRQLDKQLLPKFYNFTEILAVKSALHIGRWTSKFGLSSKHYADYFVHIAHIRTSVAVSAHDLSVLISFVLPVSETTQKVHGRKDIHVVNEDRYALAAKRCTVSVWMHSGESLPSVKRRIRGPVAVFFCL